MRQIGTARIDTDRSTMQRRNNAGKTTLLGCLCECVATYDQ